MKKVTKKLNGMAIFEGRKIRRHWDERQEKWYFSVVDIIFVLTGSVNPTDYLKKLRKRDTSLGNYIGTNCPQVEMVTEVGKNRKTLAANPEQLFRIIQSISSPKAEPVKLWLAKIGYERVLSFPRKRESRIDIYRFQIWPRMTGWLYAQNLLRVYPFK